MHCFQITTSLLANFFTYNFMIMMVMVHYIYKDFAKWSLTGIRMWKKFISAEWKAREEKNGEWRRNKAEKWGYCCSHLIDAKVKNTDFLRAKILMLFSFIQVLTYFCPWVSCSFYIQTIFIFTLGLLEYSSFMVKLKCQHCWDASFNLSSPN